MNAAAPTCPVSAWVHLSENVGIAHTKATKLVATLRDMANHANRNPLEGFPGVGDLDDVTDQAEALALLLEGLS